MLLQLWYDLDPPIDNKCSNCRRELEDLASVRFFRCQSCKVDLYCSEACRSSHLNAHEEVCLCKAAIVAALDTIDNKVPCTNDECVREAVMVCGRCKSAMYCGQECQKIHWKKAHKVHCKKMKEHQQEHRPANSSSDSMPSLRP